MKVDYDKRLTPVIRYLEKHFNEPLNLHEVAAQANLSPYHFHRIFKAVQGETLAEFIRRLRLEQAANDLFRSKEPVLNVALDYGFSSSQSLAKAFKQNFGVTPSAFRECESYDAFSALTRSSKIGHALRKNGNVRSSASPYTDSYLQIRSSHMETQHFTASKLAYIRVVGPYGKGYQEPCGRLYQWAGSKGQAGNTCIFIYHDNPEITPEDKCRTDICLMVDDNIEVPNGIELQDFPGGQYSTVRHTVTDASEYAAKWEELTRGIIAAGLEADNRPCFELYHSIGQNPCTADVTFCTAIK
ncbi:AraC family transcriptional regulator [Enterovibrio coralii]|uniref:AraC family transcriptional regulator n=1 Tax=Enterovibrio coralii TaxID=294935 RepID=A0A135I5K7_9GAMM|nr:helix-turn-helix domain-containing protein [Enterovibrio coralii]KXF80738.1 AraC family transcriptional regulator [Enterovibrio coralii]